MQRLSPKFILSQTKQPNAIGTLQQQQQKHGVRVKVMPETSMRPQFTSIRSVTKCLLAFFTSIPNGILTTTTIL